MKNQFRILASLLFLASAFIVFGQPTPNVLKNPWSTNLSGTPVYGVSNLSVTNQGEGRWNFYGTNATTVARLGDVTNAVSASTNGLAGTNYVNNATNALATTNYVNNATNALVNTNSTRFIKSLDGQGTNTSIRSSDAYNIPFQVRTNLATTDPVFLVNSNSFIGIGTNQPQTKLHVVRGFGGGSVPIPAVDIMAVENSASAYINIISGTNSEGGFFFSDDVRAKGIVAYSHGLGGYGPSDSLNFVAGGGYADMTIDQDGRVGIGTNRPQSKLHVTDLAANSVPGIRISDDLQSWAFRVKGDENDQLQFVNINNGFVPMTISSNCAENTLVLTNGNAGIGTNAPTAKLEVYGRIQGAYGSATCSTGLVTVATSASTNLFRGFNYAKTYATVSMATNTTFVMANAGDVLISFGARIGGSIGNTIGLHCYTNGVHCSLAMINYTVTATAPDESGFKQFVVSLPAAATIDLRVANTAAANTTVDQVCFNVMGPN